MVLALCVVCYLNRDCPLKLVFFTIFYIIFLELDCNFVSLPNYFGWSNICCIG